MHAVIHLHPRQLKAVVPTQIFFQGNSLPSNCRRKNHRKRNSNQHQQHLHSLNLFIYLPKHLIPPKQKKKNTPKKNKPHKFLGVFFLGGGMVGFFKKLLKNTHTSFFWSAPQVQSLAGRGQLHSCSCCSCSGIPWQSSTPMDGRSVGVHQWESGVHVYKYKYVYISIYVSFDLNLYAYTFICCFMCLYVHLYLYEDTYK